MNNTDCTLNNAQSPLKLMLAAELFSKLDSAAQDKIIRLIEDLLSRE